MLPVGHTGRISNIRYSPDGKKIISVSLEKRIWETPVDNTVKIWEAATGKLLSDLHLFTGEFDEMKTPLLEINPDGTRVISVSKYKNNEAIDNAASQSVTKYVDTIKVWDVINNSILFTIHAGEVTRILFSPDGKLFAFDDGDQFKVYNVIEEKLISVLKIQNHSVNDGYGMMVYQYHRHAEKGATDILGFNADNSKIIVMSDDGILWLYDVLTGKLIKRLKGFPSMDVLKHAIFSPDRRKLIIFTSGGYYESNSTILRWSDAAGESNYITDASGSGATIEIPMKIGDIMYDFPYRQPCFSADNQSILVAAGLSHIKSYNTVTGKLNFIIKGHQDTVTSFQYNSDGKMIITASTDSSVKVWDASNGKLILTLKQQEGVYFAALSPDRLKIVTVSAGFQIKIWDASGGKLIADIGNHPYTLSPVFSPDGKQVITTSDSGIIHLWNEKNENKIVALKGLTTAFRAMFDSANDPSIILIHGDTSKVWSIINNTLVDLPNGSYKDPAEETDTFNYENYISPDKKKYLAFVNKDPLNPFFKSIITEVAVCKINKDVQQYLSEADTIQLMNIIRGLGYSEIADSNKLSVLQGHTDLLTSASFSPDGRHILTTSRDNTLKIWSAETYQLLFTFFTINDKDFLVVDKDNHFDGTEAARKLLYFTCGDELVELAQLKDQLWVPNLASRLMKGEKINALNLPDLNICGLTPELIVLEENNEFFKVKITARRGGISETILYVNNIEAHRYPINTLIKKEGYFELTIKKKEFSEFLKSGDENVFMLKAFTKDNFITSRGVIVKDTDTSVTKSIPNLYAVMVGISDYKGDKIDLNYAAKDAADLSLAIAAASGRMLNTDGKEHVKMFNINTGKTRDIFPEKKSIKNIFDSIGKMSMPNDILLIFFAGHGVIKGDKKTFYFLTSDASGFEDVTNCGISSVELSEWIKPDNIKAQKRILILDACNSGQAINELVNIGGTGQGFMAARNDDVAEQIKAIDKLNEKSGLFILSASASAQSAYEMNRYNQGILTYALLKVIRDQPDVLENQKYLNVNRWFNAAEIMVTDLAKENRFLQNPQLVSTTNFNIGIVDDLVREMIRVETEKPIFTSCNFQNSDELIADDDLQLNKLINQQLKIISSGNENKLVYMPESNAPGLYSLSGRYIVKENDLLLKIKIRQNGQVKKQFEVNGKKDKKEILAKKVADELLIWLKLKN